MKTLLLTLSAVLFACGGAETASDASSAGGDGSVASDAAAPAGASDDESGLKITKKTGAATDAPLFQELDGGEAAITGAPSGQPRFVAQEGWVEQPPSSGMRFKQYVLPGSTPDLNAELVVARWPQGIGPLETNLDRWVSQTGSATPARDLTDDQRWVTEPEGYLVTHIHVEGVIKPTEGMAPDIVSRDQGAILAGFVETDGSPEVWTVKINGPSVTVQAHKDRYLAFIAGF